MTDPIVQIPSPGWDKDTADALLAAAEALDQPQDVVGTYSDGYTAPTSVADQADVGYCTQTAPGGA